QMEESLQRLSSMPLTAEIMYRTGAGKVLRGYFSHASLGSLARSIVESSEISTFPSSSSNEYFLPTNVHASFYRKRHIIEDTVNTSKKYKLSSSDEDTDEETFSRERELTRPYGGKAKEENSIPLEATEEVEEEKK
ncbi:hypothetical protein PFISCL1PPCAC_24578, partial [Pristionchus fissidentatus]